ncbi:MAG: hypothetical protein NVV62_16725 [Terricaulis sp.]|nr:hypothetical protein [Terricaulis sp.]
MATANGGMDLIRITDDGHGMDRDDLMLRSSATRPPNSASADDLDDIRTLGFRGEVTPPSAPSRASRSPRPAGAETGLAVVVDNGRHRPMPRWREPRHCIEMRDFAGAVRFPIALINLSTCN